MARLEILREIDRLQEKCTTCTAPVEQRNSANSPCGTTCEVGMKMIELGKELSANNRKVGHILSKGEDMTISELKYLLDRGMTKRELYKALGYYDNKGTQLTRMLESAGAL